MSAYFDKKKEHFITLPRRLNVFEFEMVCFGFDEQVNYDIREEEYKQKEIKFLKRTCWIKTLTIPLELPLTLLFLGKEGFKERLTLQKYYWKFLINKMSLDDFKIQLNFVLQNSKI